MAEQHITRVVSYELEIPYDTKDGVVLVVSSGRNDKSEVVGNRLQKLGFRVDLAPVEFENYCLLEMCGHEVFRCNIRYLSFNTPLENDVVAQRAIEAVLESYKKFKRARSYLWFWQLLEESMFKRALGPKDYWPTPVSLPPVTSCFTCDICKNSDENKNYS